MKLKISVQTIYPDDPPKDGNTYPTRHVDDDYEQTIEIEESVIAERLEAIIKAFNRFYP